MQLYIREVNRICVGKLIHRTKILRYPFSVSRNHTNPVCLAHSNEFMYIDAQKLCEKYIILNLESPFKCEKLYSTIIAGGRFDMELKHNFLSQENRAKENRK